VQGRSESHLEMHVWEPPSVLTPGTKTAEYFALTHYLSFCSPHDGLGVQVAVERPHAHHCAVCAMLDGEGMLSDDAVPVVLGAWGGVSSCCVTLSRLCCALPVMWNTVTAVRLCAVLCGEEH
jgi:hypothetical protein